MTLSIFAAARAAPEQLAVIAEGRGFTFAELATRVRGACAFLRANGVTDAQSPRPVALRATLDLRTLELVYALFELGIPALLLHPRWTAREQQAVLKRVDPSLYIQDASDIQAFGRLASADQASFQPARIAAILATSGSTGEPKLASLSHRAFIASAHANRQNLGTVLNERWLLCMPLSHIGGLSIVTRCLLMRACVVLLSNGDSGLLGSLDELSETVVQNQATLLSLVPAVLDRWLETEPLRLSHSLRAVLVGGSGTRPELLSRATAQRLPVLTSYGMTETCSQIATQRPATVAPVKHGIVASGLPLAGIEVRLEHGSIEVRGPTLFSGYWGSVHDVDYQTEWFQTQDRGFIDETGNLYVLGRQQDLIITGGENVDPTEVENVLLSHPGVRHACVVALEDPVFGQTVAALVVIRGDLSRPTAGELARACAAELAPFKRPRKIAIVAELPRKTSGKLDLEQAKRLVRERGESS